MIDKNTDIRSLIDETIRSIRSKTDFSADTGIILGTGLGALVKEIDTVLVIDYNDIPHFPLATVEFHSGKLIFGSISGKSVIAMQGRFHYYEGYSMQEITYPVRILKELGVKNLIISNACGSMNPLIPKGSLMLIEDHINLLGDNPLIGRHDSRMGPRFPDMSRPWNPGLIEKCEQIALSLGIKIYKGVYAAMSGPSLETRAEYRFLRAIGADAVGMSTVPENIVANQLGMIVLGISIITDECYPESLKEASIEEIIATAEKAEPYLTALTKTLISKL